jgi:small-conductance mechanosensitive channel
MELEMLKNIDLSFFASKVFLDKVLTVLIYLFVGSILIRLIAFIVKRAGRTRMGEQSYMLVRKGIIYFGYGILLIMILSAIGVDFTALLGAAGIIGVAMGIASKNSLGNIISGLFLLGEKSFAIGDVIRIEDQVGAIHSIDLLSIKLRTFENTFVRIPHEKIINANLVNVTHFPIRRMDFRFRIGYREDCDKVKSACATIARENNYVLNEPEHYFITDGFDDYGIKVTFGVWFYKTDYTDLKNSIIIQIQNVFAEQGIVLVSPVFSVKTDLYG